MHGHAVADPEARVASPLRLVSLARRAGARQREIALRQNKTMANGTQDCPPALLRNAARIASPERRQELAGTSAAVQPAQIVSAASNSPGGSLQLATLSDREARESAVDVYLMSCGLLG